MKAHLATMEPKQLMFWEAMGVYQKILQKNQERPTYLLHDGPPYPNGNIHLGHALNKILKDVVVKSKNMMGSRAPYVPGWDCHGLPIEAQLIKEEAKQAAKRDPVAFRKKCADYALDFVEKQKEQFIRLGVLGDWEHPYLTLNPAYEAAVIGLFGELAEQGYVYKGRKPIHWCPHCQTALAEAELEYKDLVYPKEHSPAIFVAFPLAENASFPKGTSLVVWTTTPWTLLANVAVCVHPDLDYVLVNVKGKHFILAQGLLESVGAALGWEQDAVHIEKIIRGSDLEKTPYHHPFLPAFLDAALGDTAHVVCGDLVTLEHGSGCVHIAPGHGEEDYRLGLTYQLPIVMPVDEKGFTMAAAKPYDGLFVGKQTLVKDPAKRANTVLLTAMTQQGTFLGRTPLTHSYPHCWRCLNPVIFRATYQWFISVDHQDLRKRALDAIGTVSWVPPWGENRIRSMVEKRPDWCISRQRSWGIPIPALRCITKNKVGEPCGEVLFTGKVNQAIRDLVQAKGTLAWFETAPKDFLPPDITCPQCRGTSFQKEQDIMDVWLESGSSHRAVLATPPADLYLEGSDQHRGWFQTSLLTAMGTNGAPPYRAVLTHGFLVDETGQKMSKSQGNVVDPQKVIQEYGADILRLWVAASDFRGDISVSKNILGQVRDSYLKIRNTCRFLLSNLNDLPPGAPPPLDTLASLDQWALGQLAKLQRTAYHAYETFELHTLYHQVVTFCVNDLSARYLDIVKDRLYCNHPNDPSRRSTQWTLLTLVTTLTKLLAPLLSFTMEEIWQNLRAHDLLRSPSDQAESVLLLDLTPLLSVSGAEALTKKWGEIFALREEVTKALETARTQKMISHSLEANVTLPSKLVPPAWGVTETDLADILIVSQLHIDKGGETIQIQPAEGNKCERCWKFSKAVGTDKTYPTLCERCQEVLKMLATPQVKSK